MKDRQAFEDLIFENRNKEYGAYKLRSNYSRLVNRSTLIAVVLMSLLVIIPFIEVLTEKEDNGVRIGSRAITVEMDNLQPPKDEMVQPPEAPPPPPSQPVVKYIPPVIVDSIPPNVKQPPTMAEIEASSDKDNKDLSVSNSASDNELMGDPNGTGGDEPFMIVEVKPTFRGGDEKKFRDWVVNRVIYPKEAENKKIHGKVMITFVIERDGSVSNVTILKGVDPLLDDAAKKAIESSPKWSPGLQRGKPVRFRFSIALNFQL
ncbi:MAG TPA: TonB family protein [Bacteroidales bacterium]|nr:TonB family protein [Bacteroidales bacterium]